MHVFIYDKLLTEYAKLKIPMTFVCFACVENTKMYWSRKHFVAVDENYVTRKHGSNQIYGAVFYLHDAFYYVRILDAYYGCSKSRLYSNNPYDLMYRNTCKAFPIVFESLEDFKKYKYKTQEEPISCEIFMGNPFDEKLARTVHAGRKRNKYGIDHKNFIKFYEGVFSNGW